MDEIRESENCISKIAGLFENRLPKLGSWNEKLSITV